MPTLHLPAAHTDTDVALATEVAHVVGSHELYVTWTHGEGPGLPPEIEALTADEPQPSRDLPVRRGRRRDGPGHLGALERDRCTRRARAPSCPRRATTAAPRSTAAEDHALARFGHARRSQAGERPARALHLRAA